jgi:hypothetical protein
LIFLAHFPLADLGLWLLFARTARSHTPLAARLAAEMIGLRSPAVHQSRHQLPLRAWSMVTFRRRLNVQAASGEA